MKVYKTLILLTLLLTSSSTFSQTTKMRGNIIDVKVGQYRYDYYDVSEKDSDYNYLEEQGYQGGGPSWEGIIYGLLKLRNPAILQGIEFDAEGDGIAIWSNKREYLAVIAQLVTEVKKDKELLRKAIQLAEEDGKME